MVEANRTLWLMPMEAVILIGIQGTGKTTFCRQRFFDTHVRLSLDMLKTRYREDLLISACIVAKQPFVVDNTNITQVNRERYIRPARELNSESPVTTFFAMSSGRWRVTKDGPGTPRCL
jgi:hypothetical protein